MHCSSLSCRFINLLQCSVFFTTTIAINLQIVWVHGILQPIRLKKLEKYYIFVPILLAFGFSIAPLIAGEIGLDPQLNECWYKHQHTTVAIIWEWASLFGPITLNYRLFHIHANFGKLYPGEKLVIQGSPTITVIRRVVVRVSLYPLVPIVCLVPNILSTLSMYFTSWDSGFLGTLTGVIQASQGFINALVFLVDPVIWNVWRHSIPNSKLPNATSSLTISIVDETFPSPKYPVSKLSLVRGWAPPDHLVQTPEHELDHPSMVEEEKGKEENVDEIMRGLVISFL
ncbi:hypothetical protein BC937DRAFT_91087 [Endogone sp. FLAS-F59071]|nr:hypothetical protein BC937DRAFT_91087 [Endogone sp. FLAS-F59071]|eukprot:RUS16547.1 hypothetical protein BC937DRAFT_91087 [Endogone sp. FLAS-F59071]